MKQKIIDLMWKSTITSYGRGSCGELGDSFQSIDGDDISMIADDICNLIDENYILKEKLLEVLEKVQRRNTLENLSDRMDIQEMLLIIKKKL